MSNQTSRRLTRREITRSALAAAMTTPLIRHAASAQSTPTASPSASPAASGTLISEDFRAQVASWMKDLVIPGAAIGVVLGDQRESAYFGVTSVDDPTDVAAETLFQIGSISKTFTATALMQFVDLGDISLEDTVRTYIPDFAVADAEVSKNVKIRNLVTHTSGWLGDPPIEGTEGEDALELVIAETRDLPQIAPLDGPFSYNNANVAILGRVLEVVAGDTFENFMQSNVLDPLGLRNSFYDPERALDLPHVVGHDTGPDGNAVVQEPYALPRIARPAGGIIATIDDLLTYGSFHAGIGVDLSDVLPDAQRLAMQDALVPGGSLGPFRPDGIGVSWFIVERDGVRILMHAGDTIGQQSLLVIVPEQEFVFAMMTNSNAGEQLCVLAARELLNTILGITALDDQPGKPLKAEEITPTFGTYTGPDGSAVTIETAFVAQGPPRIVLLGEPEEEPAFLDSLEKDVWYVETPFTRSYFDFVHDEQDAISWIRASGRIIPKVS